MEKKKSMQRFVFKFKRSYFVENELSVVSLKETLTDLYCF